MTSEDNSPAVKTRAPDPRPARTRAAIYRAAAELSETTGADISVNDIVKKASVSRASFYAHFSNLEDVAGGLVDSQLEELHEMARQQMVEGSATVEERIRSSVRGTTAFIGSHRAFLRGVLAWRISHHSYAVITRRMAEKWEIALGRLEDEGTLPAGIDKKVYARFLAGGTLDLYVEWLLDDSIENPESPEQAEALAERVCSVLPDWLLGRQES